MAETQKERIMRVCGISAEEAEEVLAYDKAIDRGADPTPLTAEQKKVEKQMRQADRKPTVYKFNQPKERKSNPTKASIIAEIAQFLTENSENAVENLEITNAERQIAFKIGENSYEITLIQKRKPKT